MSEYDEFPGDPEFVELPEDEKEADAVEVLEEFFEKNRKGVFFSRQLEVLHEEDFFHWVTNRAVRQLVERGDVVSETKKLSFGGEIHLLWHRGNRYYRREAKRVLDLGI